MLRLGLDRSGASASHNVDDVFGIKARQAAGLNERIQDVVFVRRQRDHMAGAFLRGAQRAAADADSGQDVRLKFLADDQNAVLSRFVQRDDNPILPRQEQSPSDGVSMSDFTLDLRDRFSSHKDRLDQRQR